MSACVVDSSVAIKWFVAEDDSALAERLLTDGSELNAPALLRSEVGNALWNNHRKGMIGSDQALMAIEAVGQTIARWHRTEGLTAKALQLAIELGHPIYDLLYLLLADDLGIPLVTADRRLVRRLAGTRWAGTVTPLSEWHA